MIKFLKTYSYDIFKLFLSQLALAVFGLVMTMWTASINDTVFLYVGIFCVVFYVYLLYLIMRDLGTKDMPSVESGRAKPFLLKGFFISLCANALNIICGIMVFVFGFFLIYQQPVAVVSETGAPVQLYYKAEGDDTLYIIDKVYSDTGDELCTYDNGKRETTLKAQDASGIAHDVTVCDGDGNELLLYSAPGGIVNTMKNPVANWASDLYGVPMVIATFTQSMFKAVHVTLFANADWFYLVMPIPAILACTLAYILGVKGKRILFFLPEIKDPKRKRARY